MRILITGINGFCGRHLADYLLEKGEQVFGLDRVRDDRSPLPEQIRFYVADICDAKKVRDVLTETAPDVIYHLAAVIKSADLNELYGNNVLGTVALFEAVIQSNLSPSVLITSSSAVYGAGTGEKPITERSALHPQTHYGITKAAQESVALCYYRTFHVPVYCTRAFNLIGPGQSPELACSAFARQIAISEETSSPSELSTGNLGSFRDFIDVRDAVKAYHLVATKGRPGTIYNVCSGNAVSMQRCLDMLLEMSSKKMTAVIDPRRFQVNDVSIQVGSADKLYRRTGWKPENSLSQSLMDLLDYWRKKTRSPQLEEEKT